MPVSASACRQNACASGGTSSTPVAQRRQTDADHCQPEAQVLPKRGSRATASASGRLVAATMRTSIARVRVFAEPADLALLQHAKQLGLCPRRQLADLVEKQRAAVRLLEEPDARPNRARERAPRVAEQLGLDQLVGERGAVDRAERGGPGAG